MLDNRKLLEFVFFRVSVAVVWIAAVVYAGLAYRTHLERKGLIADRQAGSLERALHLASTAPDNLKRACLNEVQDGTCRVLMRMYGTNAIVDIPGGDCLASMSAVRYALPSTEVIDGPIKSIDDLKQ